MDTNKTLNNRSKGSSYEHMAAEYLIERGYFIIEMNYNSCNAELDIIARDKDTIVFVEVKYRSNGSYGYPIEAVDIRKQKRICRAALCYMTKNKISVDNTAIRFDVIGILGKEITHVENAFEYIR